MITRKIQNKTPQEIITATIETVLKNGDVIGQVIQAVQMNRNFQGA
jgi:hypothetical protein